ncbi:MULTISPECIES: DEAD/DEAH box helicase [Sorangium]|uniref:DEAD/DEAH box helicase n=1 Tax=Sorangium TaxID=39643 RepID=UPI003D9C634A
MEQRRSAPSWQEIRQMARERFGVKTFRPGQRELIEAVLAGRDALGLLPTGAGKSLCYQLPALLLPGPAVVVSPLISLMQDQQEKLAEADIPAAKLNSTLSATEERETVDGIRHGDLPLIYVTPERLENPEYLDQEAGRAGRDGRPARGVLLYRVEDRRIQAFFLGGKYPRPDESYRVYETIGRLEAQRADGKRRAGIPVKALAEAADLPERKVKVVVALLEAAGIIDRSRGVRRLRDFADEAELDAFLKAYEERRAGDRERLEAVMRYAESPACRMAVMKAYFEDTEAPSGNGGAAVEACGRCDNCRHTEDSNRAVVDRLTAAAPP